jgi:tRNA dimethylallyltransferase
MAPNRHRRERSQTTDSPGTPTLPCVGDCSAGDGARAPAGIIRLPLPSQPPRLGADCWILSGPTGGGKTALALEIACRLDAEIVSVDSIAVYRGLDIGTAKPTAAERDAVPHHCLDLVSPDAAFSVAQWLVTATEAVEAIRGRGKRILFVGGTPLYLRSLRDGLAPLPAEDPQIRQQLSHEATLLGPAALHSRLRTIDAAAASRIHPNDTRRIVRALEVVAITGRPMSAVWQLAEAAMNPASPAFTAQMLVVDLPRRILYDRIERRVEAMFSGGLIEETRAALAGGGIGPIARQAAGYTEAIGLIEGRLSRDAAIEQTKTRTRQLAKRQLTWLRRFKDAIWVTA